jgi:thiamine transport system permease protein
MVALALVAWLLTKLGDTRSITLATSGSSTTRRTHPAIVAAIAGIYVVIICTPLVHVVSRSIIVRDNVTWAGWRQVFTGDFGGMVMQSLEYAIVASILTLVIGYGVAHSIVHRKMRTLESLSAATLTVSSVTLGLAIIVTFNDPPLDLRSWWLITPIAHTLVALPIVVRTITPVVAAIPPGLSHAAATLGAAPGRSWWTVQWPLVRGGALASLAMSFAVSVGEFGATSFLTRRASETMPVAIARLLGRPGDVNQLGAYAMATILIVICAMAVALLERSKVTGSR